MDFDLTGQPLLVFEQQGILVPYKVNPEATDSNLSIDLENSGMFIPDSNKEIYERSLFELVREGKSSHSQITQHYARQGRKRNKWLTNRETELTAREYADNIRMSSQSDALLVRQQMFRTTQRYAKEGMISLDDIDKEMAALCENVAQDHATVLYTPYFTSDVTQGLHTRVYLAKHDLESNPTTDISWLSK